MKIKNIWRLFPIVIFIGMIIFFERKSYNEYKEFHMRAINSHIVRKKYNWSGGKSYDYMTENNITITMMSTHSLMIRDSISKAANSDDFKVYRKNKLGKYELYKSYNINDK